MNIIQNIEVNKVISDDIKNYCNTCFNYEDRKTYNTKLAITTASLGLIPMHYVGIKVRLDITNHLHRSVINSQ